MIEYRILITKHTKGFKHSFPFLRKIRMPKKQKKSQNYSAKLQEISFASLLVIR